jgi:hypothetical protein
MTALAPWESKNLSSSSKSFVGLAILSPPFGAELLDDGDAFVGRHSRPEFGVARRFIFE